MLPTIERINPNCTIMTVGNRVYYFSYTTCVGYENQASGIYVRRYNEWGNTTAKHMNAMGIKHFPAHYASQFETIIAEDHGIPVKLYA